MGKVDNTIYFEIVFDNFPSTFGFRKVADRGNNIFLFILSFLERYQPADCIFGIYRVNRKYIFAYQGRKKQIQGNVYFWPESLMDFD